MNSPEEARAAPLAELASAAEAPGTMYESLQSLPPGRGLEHYGYEASEYFVSGSAAGRPYRTRIVVRRPADAADFSGLVVAEAMHPSGSAHIFEFSSEYAMQEGHGAVEIVVAGLELLSAHHAERYAGVQVAPDQVSEVLAQVGAMLRDSPDSPFAANSIRHMVLGGTSATAAILIRYLPAHRSWRRPSGGHIFEGFLAHSNGSNIPPVDVPLIQVPTMTEIHSGAAPIRQDSDAPGEQYRLYEFAGMGHVDSRWNVRLQPNPCVAPGSPFPLQAYLSVALHHLLSWVDAGLPPPRAPRVLLDRNGSDGSLMALDQHGNPIGGVRNPYLDVPSARHGVPNTAAVPLINAPSAYIASAGLPGAELMCRLSAYAEPFSTEKLRELYGSQEHYLRLFQAALDEMEAAGWSLPHYRELILGDARSLAF